MAELSPNIEQTSSRETALISSFRLDFLNLFAEQGRKRASKIGRYLTIGLMFLIAHYGHKL